MSKEKEPVFLFVGVYDDPAIAEEDLDLVRNLHDTKVIGTYDAGIATKDAEGNVKVKRAQSKHPGWTGIGAGAVVGLLFPPSILAMAVVGGAAGGVIGHFSRALSRSDVKELGDMLDSGQAALIVIGKDKISAELEKAGLRALKRTEKELDVDSKDLQDQLTTAASLEGTA